MSPFSCPRVSSPFQKLNLRRFSSFPLTQRGRLIGWLTRSGMGSGRGLALAGLGLGLRLVGGWIGGCAKQQFSDCFVDLWICGTSAALAVSAAGRFVSFFL